MKLAFAFAFLTLGAADDLVLHVVSKTQASQRGAVCLDGSPPGFYFRKASDLAATNKWVVYMQGGAWCSSPQSCASRATGHLGNSSTFPPTYHIEGMLDDDLHKNPTFGTWNHVVLAYCDGASFSGDAEPLLWPDPNDASQNMTLYFRGRRVLELLVQVLLEEHGMAQAEEVILAGGSAGGLATFLQADRVGSLLPSSVRKYRAVPVSGFFLMHTDLAGDDRYVEDMYRVYKLHNVSASIATSCAASLAPDDEWKCFFANYSYAHSQTSMFPIQSSVDLYQLFAILRAGGWDAGCLNRGIQFANCTEAQLRSFNDYAASLLADWGEGLTQGKATRAGEGAFIESCLEHVAEQNSAMFDGYVIGGVSMQQALSKWWLADGTQPAVEHHYLPCELSLAPPHQCNPTCFAGKQRLVEQLDRASHGALSFLPESLEISLEISDGALLSAWY